MIRIRGARPARALAPTPRRGASASECTLDALEHLFWERRFDESPLDDVAQIPPLADEAITILDLTADPPAIRWQASPLEPSTSDLPPICWHAGR